MPVVSGQSSTDRPEWMAALRTSQRFTVAHSVPYSPRKTSRSMKGHESEVAGAGNRFTQRDFSSHPKKRASSGQRSKNAGTPIPPHRAVVIPSPELQIRSKCESLGSPFCVSHLPSTDQLPTPQPEVLRRPASVARLRTLCPPPHPASEDDICQLDESVKSQEHKRNNGY